MVALLERAKSSDSAKESRAAARRPRAAGLGWACRRQRQVWVEGLLFLDRRVRRYLQLLEHSYASKLGTLHSGNWILDHGEQGIHINTAGVSCVFGGGGEISACLLAFETFEASIRQMQPPPPGRKDQASGLPLAVTPHQPSSPIPDGHSLPSR